MKQPTMNMDDLGRRQFIAHAAKACLGVGLLPMMGDYVSTPVSALTPGVRPATARHVIYLNMSGGMSHIDTFDPKPENPDVQGPVKAIKTSADGVLLTENLAKTASQMHNACVIRSCVTSQGAHEQAGYLSHTSYVKRGTIVHPSFGSWVAKLSGQINRTIPMNIRIGGGSNEIGAGFLESKYGPLPIGNPKAGLANSKMADYLNDERFDRRLAMAGKMNSTFSSRFPQKKVRAYSDLYKDAVKLMRSEDLKAFDIAQEPENVHELYGESNFGQGCLLARRLIENQVRYVEVTRGGWDTHDDNFTRVAENCQDLDQALSALLFDLELRGLLKETLVVLTSEFGRTPDINPRSGRDHWPKFFSAFLAGGGIKGGMSYGKSDRTGKELAEDKVVMPWDINATMAYALGLPLNKIMYSPSGRPFTVAHKGKPISEILA